jgi:hypothetical protein
MNKPAVFLALLAIPFTAAAEVVIACDIGAGPTMRVEVIREAPLADTYVYLLRQNGKATPVFSHAVSSRGTSVRAACVGKKHRALFLSGEFGANAVQGFVLTCKPGRRKVGRLDFADKRRAEWLFLSKADAIVLVPTHGLGEASKKFVAYRQAMGSSGAPAGEGIDRLPKARGYEKVALDISSLSKRDRP